MAINGLAVIGGLAAVGEFTWIIWLNQRLNALTSPSQPKPTMVPALSDFAAHPANDDGDIAAIAAAVYAMLGCYRIVHIEDANGGQRWAAEGRWMHQISHNPHYSRK